MTSSPAESPPERPIAERSDLLVLVRGLAGAIVGGAIGYVVFRWLLSYGYYALILPGAALGIGAGLAARGQSTALGIVATVAALALGIYARWVVDAQPQSLLTFITHLHQLSPVTLLMLAVGAFCGWWFGRGR